MCGRFYQDLLEEDLQEYFAAEPSLGGTPASRALRDDGLDEAVRAPRFNIGPGQQILVVRRDKQHDQRALSALHWGLIPHFAKDKKGAYRCINARAETVETMPSYRAAFQKRRCLVVAHGFYEWRALGPKHKQPYAIARADRGPLALAGLWENWLDPTSGQWLRSVAIVTTEANATLRSLHERMPVVLEQQDFARWLGEQPASLAELKGLLAPSARAFELWPVDPRMNRASVDDADILRPIVLPDA